MNKADFVQTFNKNAVAYGQEINAAMVEVYFDDLCAFPADVVDAAFTAHRRDPEAGKFFPRIADVMAQIEKMNPSDRPTPNEAWSTFLAFQDDTRAVWFTEEIAAAMQAAQPIFENNPKSEAARMAFREVYEREMDFARARNRPVRWQLSTIQGDADGERRREAYRLGVRNGYITREQGIALNAALPPPMTTEGQKLLAAIGEAQGKTEKGLAALSDLRKMLSGGDA